MDRQLLNNPHLMTEDELEWQDALHDVAQRMPADARETLRALLTNGPLSDGDVPSKQGRDWLLEASCASKIIVGGQDGYQAATYKGRDVFRHLFIDPDGKIPETLLEALSLEETHRVLRRFPA